MTSVRAQPLPIRLCFGFSEWKFSISSDCYSWKVSMSLHCTSVNNESPVCKRPVFRCFSARSALSLIGHVQFHFMSNLNLIAVLFRVVQAPAVFGSLTERPVRISYLWTLVISPWTLNLCRLTLILSCITANIYLPPTLLTRFGSMQCSGGHQAFVLYAHMHAVTFRLRVRHQELWEWCIAAQGSNPEGNGCVVSIFIAPNVPTRLAQSC